MAEEGRGAASQDVSGVEVPFREVLTDDEIRALLSPFGETEGQEPGLVLLLTDSSEDEERLASYLRTRGVAVVATRDAFAAIDLLRARRYELFVAASHALPPRLVWYVERLREIDPEIPLCLLRDSDAASLPPLDAVEVERPLTDEVLERVLRLTRGGHVAAVAEPVVASVEPQAGKPPPGTDGRLPVGGPIQTCDPLLAVQALLEAKADGKDVGAGLRRWAERDPGIRGVVEFDEDASEWRVRARAREPRDRRRMVLLLLEQMEKQPSNLVEPRTVGGFSLFPLPRGVASGLALWHGAGNGGAAALERLRSILPLLERVQGLGEDGKATAARARFLALLDTRIRATARREGRLGLLILATSSGEDPATIRDALRSLLRGGDWVEVVGDRVYVILDEPEEGVFKALGARLRALPAIDRLQVVALAWDPTKGRAAEFLDRAERILGGKGRGEHVPGVTA